MSKSILIVGLGNPGKEYEGTRHNVGFDVVDEIAMKYGVKIGGSKFNSLCETITISGDKVVLLKPQTFMNRSGHAVATCRGFYKIEFDDVIVVADDMALDPGVIRLRGKGSAGGHNGLKDIIEKLGTDQFPRLRVGIGRSPFPDSRGFVLGRPSGDEKELISQAQKKAVKCIECFLSEGLAKAMTEYNSNNN